MITLQGLTKRYREKIAVDDLTLEVAPGRVTGFLGPNGAGKSTTMRMLLGLDAPTVGEALIGGRRYVDLPYPMRTVGALLEATSVHPGRTARHHLIAQAHTHGIPIGRVDQVLDIAGLTDAARSKAGSFSLGMRQRLGIAGALLGDPEVLLLDEPVNGLDPDGVRWVRDLVRALAAEGRTVFISSHLMTEMQLTADHLVILGRGRLIADATLADLMAGHSGRRVRLGIPDRKDLGRLLDRLAGSGIDVEADGTTEAVVLKGATNEQIGDLAFELGLRVHELTTLTASLEQTYRELTEGSVQYVGKTSVEKAGARG